MLFKELRENLSSQPIAVKKFKAEDMSIILYKEDNHYTVMVDDSKLDEEFENILDAEEAVKDFLKLLGNE